MATAVALPGVLFDVDPRGTSPVLVPWERAADGLPASLVTVGDTVVVQNPGHALVHSSAATPRTCQTPLSLVTIFGILIAFGSRHLPLYRWRSKFWDVVNVLWHDEQ